MDNNSLQHYGVLGMRWGVRRYQSKDGSLTPAGKKRYQKEMDKLKKEERMLKNKQKTKAMIDKLDKKRQSVDELKGKDKKQSVPKKKKIKDLSDDELRNLVNRLEMERKLESLIRAESSKNDSSSSKLAKTIINDMVVPAATDLGKQATKSLMTKGLNDVLKKMDLDDEYKVYTNNKKKN